ncbi:MAG: hypothetical protein WEA11_00095 [Acidimicrobiales bacterium]
MADHDASALSPSDAAVAMATWPRRYRSAFAPFLDDDLGEWAARMGPDGISALDLAVNSVRTWILLERALHDIRLNDSPTLHPAVAQASARHWDTTGSETLETVLDQIDDVAASFAEVIAATPATDWLRTASVAGGGTLTALDVVHEAVRVGADNLRAIDRTLAALR